MIRLAEGHIHDRVLGDVGEYGRWPNAKLNRLSWGVAPGYGECWPLANALEVQRTGCFRVVPQRVICLAEGHIDRSLGHRPR